MFPRRLHLSLVLSLALLVACVWGIVLVSADLPAGELSLNPAGSVYEINHDAGGSLWISDFDAGEIWQVEASGAYTIYPVAPASAPSDARRQGLDDVWFADFLSNQLGRLSPTSLELAIWAIPGSEGLYGTAIDTAGQIWVADAFDPNLHRLTPSSGQLCTYALPDDGFSDYVLGHDQGLWLGDRVNGRILRLDPGLDQYTAWELPAGAYPTGMSFDSQGNLWWADLSLAELGRLDPGSDQLTRYVLPLGHLPQMIAASDGLIYYTGPWEGAFGILNPAIATGTTTTLTPSTLETTAACSTLQPPSTSTITPSAGTTSWSTVTYTTTHAAGGWTVYQLPEQAFPWGIAVTGSTAWLADSGRQVLCRVAPGPERHQVFLPIALRH